jgi:uncharacterized protein
MSLQKEFIHYLSRRIVDQLIKREMIEFRTPALLQERVLSVLEEEMSQEDKVNEEVRGILKDYADEMKRTGISYQEMFKAVKNKLIKEKKVIL